MKVLHGVLAVVLAAGCFVASVAPASAAAPELQVVNDFPFGPFVTGGPAALRVVIRNNGDAPSPATRFCVVANQNVLSAFGISGASCSHPLPVLTTGQTRETVFTAPNNAMPLPPGNYEVEVSVNADPAPTFAESNHDNNMVLFRFSVTSAPQPPLWNRAPSKVTSVRILSLTPNPYHGVCPVTVEAVGEITMSGPGSVRYQWNNAKFGSPMITEQFAAAGTHTVKFKVTGDDSLLASPWRLAVASPNPIEFTSSAPRISCGVPAVRVTVKPDVSIYKGACPATFTFTATVQAGAAMSLPYAWEFAGSAGPSGTLTFAAAGTRQLVQKWSFPAPSPYPSNYGVYFRFTDQYGKKMVGSDPPVYGECTPVAVRGVEQTPPTPVGTVKPRIQPRSVPR